MKFLLLTLIAHHPDPITGEKKSPAERLRAVIDAAVLAEELGFDGFAVGERHEDPFISSSPPVVLSNIAARTSTIGLFTAVTTLSLLDPVRAFEDYSTLDNLSGGRLELIRLTFARRAGLPVVFESIEDFIDRSSALIGSPQQVIDKVGRYHEQLGHEVIHLSADTDGVTAAQKRQSLELFQADVAPVLREKIPSRPLAAQHHVKEGAYQS
ncbi:hypothetical protein AFM11_18510 [Mycolicibacterium wolinskyi]|uniref:Luciferase-like domain-containing protein n=1 Tax=Mycolicibacterium wolinskyi TaxID=59750 RepID=A0A132PKL2_9MYCO|nr:LLM class flavin-dependent oxidoreductase [Mycolicibacterium wolinskyi]KWX22885.1 hypothetical protein AFM11_18510 [Mycolicibacterium wolinskyi]